MDHDEPFLLFDDCRADGAAARLYRGASSIIAADRLAEVEPALERLRGALAAGAHAAGYLSYEAGHAFEQRLSGLPRHADQPLLWFALFGGFRELGGDEVEELLGDPAGSWVGRPRPRLERDAYLAAAGRVREHLLAGDLYQANLSFGCDVALAGDPLALYARLRRQAAAGWGGIVRTERSLLLSLSPEQFFTVRGAAIEARPMKGTARRGVSPAADRAAAQALAADPKQRAENLMIVDLLRNDLARIAEPGSVEVPELFAIESFPTLHQMISRVTARLRAGVDVVAILRALFPCGSISGAPKIAAIERLAAIEQGPRGPYTGAMGWIEPGGDAAFNILIRTFEIGEDWTRARLGLGSALVVDSIAEDEWAECLAKGEYVIRASPAIDLIETMRFDPTDGIVEIDRHLDRLGAAAQALEFRFDRHGARNELQAATFGRKTAAMARMLLSPTGTMAIELRPLGDQPPVPVTVTLQPLPVDPSDYRLRFKTSDRGFYDEARRANGTFETIFADPQGRLTEGSFTNIFVERHGKLLTPPLTRGLLAGVLRAKLIDEGRAVEADLTRADLDGGFFIGNMVRGLIPAKLAD